MKCEKCNGNETVCGCLKSQEFVEGDTVVLCVSLNDVHYSNLCLEQYKEYVIEKICGTRNVPYFHFKNHSCMKGHDYSYGHFLECDEEIVQFRKVEKL